MNYSLSASPSLRGIKGESVFVNGTILVISRQYGNKLPDKRGRLNSR